MLKSYSDAHMKESRCKKIWTPEEDLKLKELVEKLGTSNWSLVGQSLRDRTGKQCRERWHNHLEEGIKKGEWTAEEDQIILSMQHKIGNQWAKITKLLPGRTDNAVKNRFHATERAKCRGLRLVGKFSEGEDYIEEYQSHTQSNCQESLMSVEGGIGYSETNSGVVNLDISTKTKENEMIYTIGTEKKPMVLQSFKNVACGRFSPVTIHKGVVVNEIVDKKVLQQPIQGRAIKLECLEYNPSTNLATIVQPQNLALNTEADEEGLLMSVSPLTIGTISPIASPVQNLQTNAYMKFCNDISPGDDIAKGVVVAIVDTSNNMDPAKTMYESVDDEIESLDGLMELDIISFDEDDQYEADPSTNGYGLDVDRKCFRSIQDSSSVCGIFIGSIGNVFNQMQCGQNTTNGEWYPTNNFGTRYAPQFIGTIPDTISSYICGSNAYDPSHSYSKGASYVASANNYH